MQQGSHLQEEISKVILELQKDRYFETLSGNQFESEDVFKNTFSKRFNSFNINYNYIISITCRKILEQYPAKPVPSTR